MTERFVTVQNDLSGTIGSSGDFTTYFHEPLDLSDGEWSAALYSASFIHPGVGLWLYSDIVEPSHVGTQMVRLLDEIPTAPVGPATYKQSAPLRWMSVNGGRGKFRSLALNFKNSDNETIAFDPAQPVRVTVVFRRQG